MQRDVLLDALDRKNVLRRSVPYAVHAPLSKNRPGHVVTPTFCEDDEMLRKTRRSAEIVTGDCCVFKMNVLLFSVRLSLR
jgi:hypothetical protein